MPWIVLQLTKVDVVVGAFETRSLEIVQFFEQAKVLQPNCVTLYLSPPLPPNSVGSEMFVPQSDFRIRRRFSGDELRLTVKQAIEKAASIEGLASHREQDSLQRPVIPVKPAGDSPSHESGKFCTILPKLSARTSTWSVR